MTAELDIALKAQLEAPPSTEPLYISIVGLGDEAAELPLLVELVDEALERLRGPRRKEELAAQLNLRFGAYDVEPLALNRADDEVPEILRAHPWLTPERVEVRFFDMTVAESVDTWTPRRLLLVLARNTLRKNVLDRGWPLIALLERYLVEGGLFGIDYEAFSYLLGPSSSFHPPPEIAKDQMSRPETLFRELGTFGVSASDENILLTRRPRSDQTSYSWPYGAW